MLEKRTNLQLFAAFARSDDAFWRLGEGLKITHVELGEGIITRVYEQDGYKYFKVRFASGHAATFNRNLLSERHFSDIQLPEVVKKQQQAEREKQARQAAKKQLLVAKLRDQFYQDFLNVHEFYRSFCLAHISPEEYELEKMNHVQTWVHDHLQSNADGEQIAAISALENHVQVVARAGSGKTTTLVNRAIFLQQHCGIAPHQILLLAFNRKAAEEIYDRLKTKISGGVPHVMTFHALAYALVHPDDILFDEPDGEQSKSRALQSVIDDYLRTEHGHAEIRALMMAHFREDWEHIALGGYDKPQAEMLRYRRSLPREGLDGKYFKSFGEKVIGDFLFEHDINYKYERNFSWNGSSYHPDFTIFTGENKGIIIEYFGLKGDPDYDNESEMKRLFWQDKQNWHFLEFSYDHLRRAGPDGLRAAVQHSFERAGIACTRLTEDEIWYRIKDRAIDRFSKVVVGFVQRCRKLSLTNGQLAAMVHQHHCLSFGEERFLELVQVFYKHYLDRLQATGEEDFDGLMQQAAANVAAGITQFRRKSGGGDLRDLRFVCIDEYQDFSDLFHRLVEAIRGQNPAVQIFCVGDDWQAINGFAGSDLRYYQNFTTLFQPAYQLHLTTNYRSATSIVNIGNALMRGLGVAARAHNPAPGSVLVAALDTFEPIPHEQEAHPGDRLTPAVVRLVTKVIADGLDVVLLSRKNSLPWYINYKDQRNMAREAQLDTFLHMVRTYLPESDRKRVSISTAHKYKGLEKGAVIILDAVPGSYPLIHPDMLFTRILGDTVDRTVAEERRLFYVAVTRAVERLIILTEEKNLSPFLEDLKGHPSVFRLNWRHYPATLGPVQRLIIRVGNQDGRGKKNTYAIKDMLSSEGYTWAGANWPNWWRTVPAAGFTAMRFLEQALWVRHSDGVEVRVYDDTENLVATYRVNQGKPECVVDAISHAGSPPALLQS